MSNREYACRALSRGQYGIVGIPVQQSEEVLYVRTQVIGPWPSRENRARLHSALSDVLTFGGATSSQAERTAQERLLEPAFRMWQCIMDSAAVLPDGVNGRRIRFNRGMTADARTWFEPSERIPRAEVDAFRAGVDFLHDLLGRPGSLAPADIAQGRALLSTYAPDSAPLREGIA